MHSKKTCLRKKRSYKKKADINDMQSNGDIHKSKCLHIMNVHHIIKNCPNNQIINHKLIM